MVIDITVTNQVGSLPSGSQLINSDNGVTYITVGAVLLNASTVQANVKAVADQAGGNGAGIIGNLQVNSNMDAELKYMISITLSSKENNKGTILSLFCKIIFVIFTTIWRNGTKSVGCLIGFFAKCRKMRFIY